MPRAAQSALRKAAEDAITGNRDCGPSGTLSAHPTLKIRSWGHWPGSFRVQDWGFLEPQEQSPSNMTPERHSPGMLGTRVWTPRASRWGEVRDGHGRRRLCCGRVAHTGQPQAWPLRSIPHLACFLIHGKDWAQAAWRKEGQGAHQAGDK